MSSPYRDMVFRDIIPVAQLLLRNSKESSKMNKMISKIRPVIIGTILTLIYPFTLSGQVSTLQDWTSLYHGTSSAQQNLSYSVPTGHNNDRLLVVAIASERTAAGTLSVTLSYGDQALTPAAGDMNVTSIQHTAIYYLDEAGLDAAVNNTLSVSVGGGTIRSTDVWAAVFEFVNQDAPFTNAVNYNSGATTVNSFSFSPELDINAYNQAIEVIGTHNSGYDAPATITYATDWTLKLDQAATYKIGFTGYSLRNSIASRTIPLSDISDASSTSLSKLAMASMTGGSLSYNLPDPPTVQASDVTFSNITSTSFTVKWTNGDGTNRLVIVRQGNAVNAVPADGTTYTANNNWMSGQEIATGNYVVYNGTADSVVVLNLEAATNYHVAVYEFSGPPSLEDYLTSIEPARGNATTLPETAVNGDYRSLATGNWGSPASWQVYTDGVWGNATAAPTSADGIITIRSGHVITVAESVTADQVIIDAGGEVIINSGITLTINDVSGGETDPVDCIVNGTLSNNGILLSTAEFTFGNGAIYNHNTNGGVIPAAEWNSRSTCNVTGITTTAPTGLGQSFGNFTWDCSSQSSSLTVAINSNITISGSCTITSTGSGRLALTDSNSSYSMTVSGSFTQTGGTFVLNGGTASTVTDYLYLAGNLQFTGGTITELSAGRGAIVFNGNGGMQTYTSGGTFQNTIDFRVETGAYLQMGTGQIPAYILNSIGTFTLEAGTTLGITSPYGITASSTANPSGGNIRVSGPRTYDSNATYIYNGNSTQYTGDGLPATLSSLVFSNTGGSIRFQKAHSITNDFTIGTGSRTNLGTYTHTTSFLSLGGEAQQSGSYGGATSGADNEIPEFFDAATGILNNNIVAGTWLGNTTDWSLASNWAGGVPLSSTTARITSYAPNQPVIGSSVSAVSNIVTINTGASLTIEGNADFSSLENIGTLTINPGGAATINSVTNTGVINLESGPSGMFSFMPGSVSGTGTINARLFILGGVAGEGLYRWHYLAVPYQLNKSVLTNINPVDLMWYSEPAAITNMTEGWQWHDGYDNTTAITDLQVSEGYAFYNEEDTYVTFTGTSPLISMPQKNLSFTVFGWNFIGNSLTCGLNWDAVVITGDVDPSVNFLKDYQEYYYIQGGPGVPAGTTGSIPPLQGFFVEANAAGGSLNFSAAKEHNGTAYYKGSTGADTKNSFPLLRLSLEGNNMKDETAIWFEENATISKDSKFDAEKNITGVPRMQIYSTLQGVSYAINGIPFPEKSIDIPLTIRTTESGKYSINLLKTENIEGYAFYLKDLEQKTRIKLNDLNTYKFTSAEGINGKRFVLTIENLSASGSELPQGRPFNMYTSSGLINIELLDEKWEGKQGTIKLIDLTGRTLTDMHNVEFNRSSVVQIPSAGNRGLIIVEIASYPLRHTGRVVVK